MAILPLVPSDDPILKTKLERFDFENPPDDPVKIAVDLTESMLAHGGIGLAANQIGLPYRVFVIAANPVLCCFNPVIVDQTTEQIELEEGCLTFPNLVLPVKRSKVIKVRYFEPNGEVVNTKFIGMTARIFQHETDHINGILFTEYVGPVKLALAKAKAKKRSEGK